MYRTILFYESKMLQKSLTTTVLTQAFKEFVHANETKKSRTRVSVKEKLKQFREVLSQKKERERVKEQKRDRDLSL